MGEHRTLVVAGAAGALALLVAGWAWSALVGRRALARRQGLVLVPTEGFDPNIEEVLRFAAAVAGCRPASSGPPLVPGCTGAPELGPRTARLQHRRGTLANAGAEERDVLSR